MSNINATVMRAAFVRRWFILYEELKKIQLDSAKLATREQDVLKELRSVAESYKNMSGESLPLTPEQAVVLKKSPSIGDTIEAMLKERGPLEKIEISNALLKTGKIAGMNPRVVLFNALKRDTKKRFKVVGRMVYLKGKTDEPR